MDDISIACGKRSCVRRRRFLSIERGEVGRERQPTCLGAGIEKCLPARRDQMSRGAPHLKRLTTGACLWQAGQEHLEPEHEHARGETSSCVLRDSRSGPLPGRSAANHSNHVMTRHLDGAEAVWPELLPVL